MQRFVLCLDGTWNNAASEVERAGGAKVYRPSNVLKVARAVRFLDAARNEQITYYDTGIGSMNRAPTGAARIVRATDNLLGGALGAGFEVNIEEAYTFLANNWSPGDEIFIFGFSRGAAQARSLCRFIEWVGGFPEKSDVYYSTHLYSRYLERYGKGSGAQFWEERNEKRRREDRPLLRPIQRATIRYLGVWDTVLALGSRFKLRGRATAEKVAFHTPESPPENVDRIRHALAIDESRHDFRPEIFARAKDGHDVQQRWFVGAHSNVGGGLADDSLANLALRWLIDEASEVGLDVDEEFLEFYRGNPLRSISRKSRGFALLDTVLWPIRGFEGERDLLSTPGTSIDQSVITRLKADPREENELDVPYRPENLLRYLDRHPELQDGLSESLKQEISRVK